MCTSGHKEQNGSGIISLGPLLLAPLLFGIARPKEQNTKRILVTLLVTEFQKKESNVPVLGKTRKHFRDRRKNNSLPWIKLSVVQQRLFP